MSTINKEQLSELLSDYTSVSKDEASRFLDAFTSVISSRVKNGEEVEVQGLGTFAIIDTQQEQMKRVALHIDDKMKEEVNAPFSCFEPYVISRNNPKKEEKVVEKLVAETPVAPVVVIEEKPKPVATSKTLENTKTSEANNSADVAKDTKNIKVTETADAAKTAKKDTTVNINKIGKSQGKKRNKYPIVIPILVILLLLAALCYLNLPQKNIKPIAKVEKVQPKPTVVADTTICQNDSASQDTVTSVPSDVIVDKVIANNTQVEQGRAIQAENKNVNASENNARTSVKTGQQHSITSVKISEEQLMKDADGNVVTAKLEPGERLTLLSLRYFGSKTFWPYIYKVNTDKLSSPGMVKANMVLNIPDPTYFDINAKDSSSVEKANKLAEELK